MLLILAIIMILYTLTIVLLFGWGFITSFKDYQSDFIKNVFGFPKKWMFSNYAAVIKAFKYPTQGGKSVYIEGMLLNTVLYALGCSFFSTLVTCITAYACGRFRYKFSNVLTSIVIVTMVLPVVGSLPSEIALAKKLHFYDNIFGMWAMKCNFLSMYYLVFYKTFRGMPRDAEEAAKIDGASNFTVMTRIMLPMVANAFATIMLIKFIAFLERIRDSARLPSESPDAFDGYRATQHVHRKRKRSKPVKRNAPSCGLHDAVRTHIHTVPLLSEKTYRQHYYRRLERVLGGKTR